jgi:hypothetical protein
MRGKTDQQTSLLVLHPQDMIPTHHPIRRIKPILDAVLRELSPLFDEMYDEGGRASVPPEHLLKASVLMSLYSVRSERQFTVDGTLLEAWASVKSFTPRDGDPPATGGGGGRNPEVDFHGQKRSNQTHQSTTDPEALLFRKGSGQPAKLYYTGHVLMENRNGLVVDMDLTQATGFAERATALELLKRQPHSRQGRRTVGADKGYDTRDFSAGCRAVGVTPHVARHTTKRRSSIDRRTTRHSGTRPANGCESASRRSSAGPRRSAAAASLLRLVAVVLRIPLAVAALILSAIVRTVLGCAVLGLLVAAIGAFFVYASTH